MKRVKGKVVAVTVQESLRVVYRDICLGAGTFELIPARPVARKRKSGLLKDREQLASDWKRVFEDVTSAVKRYDRREHPEESTG